MRPAWVSGVGLWTAAEAEPAAALLPSRLARRTSLLTRMAIEVLERAVAPALLGSIPTVWVTAHGEAQTLGALLEMLCTDGIYSPARFHHSVHNTAAGAVSIATANRAFSTTLAAGPESVAMGLLEAFALLEQRGGEVAVVFADEAPPAAFDRPDLVPAAAALVLSSKRPAQPALGSLSGLRSVGGNPAAPANSIVHNPIAPALALVQAINGRRAGPVALSSSSAESWLVDVEPS